MYVILLGEGKMKHLLSYFKKYKEGRRQIYKTGFISRRDYVYTLFLHFCVAMVPNGLRKMIYIRLLRK